MRRNTINYFLCICFLLCLPNNDLFGMNRGISSVSYNKLNLPGVIDVKSPVAEARNEYYYSSDGVKRKVIKKWNPNYSTSPVIGSAVNVSSLTSTETTDYIGNLIYEGGTLKRIQTENGYIENGVYHYYIQDYLGNTRMVLDPSAEIVQWLNYYPFGMLYGDRIDYGRQQVKFGGKEFDDKHGLYIYDFHARFYDPALGRFMTMDPLAEKYYSISPYAYCANNPVKYIDPTGKFIETAWDAFSLATGAKSFVENVKEGNVGGAIVDAIGVVADAAAVALPGVPGGAGAAIKGARAMDKAVDVVKSTKAVDKVTDATKAMDKATDAQKAIGPAGDAGATVTKQLPEAMQSNSKTTNSTKGTIFKDPENPKGNHVRVESGNSNSPNQAQQSSYVKETKNGQSIDKNGNPVNSNSSEAHIPKEEYRYNNK